MVRRAILDRRNGIGTLWAKVAVSRAHRAPSVSTDNLSVSRMLSIHVCVESCGTSQSTIGCGTQGCILYSVKPWPPLQYAEQENGVREEIRDCDTSSCSLLHGRLQLTGGPGEVILLVVCGTEGSVLEAVDYVPVREAPRKSAATETSMREGVVYRTQYVSAPDSGACS